MNGGTQTYVYMMTGDTENMWNSNSGDQGEPEDTAQQLSNRACKRRSQVHYYGT